MVKDSLRTGWLILDGWEWIWHVLFSMFPALRTRFPLSPRTVLYCILYMLKPRPCICLVVKKVRENFVSLSLLKITKYQLYMINVLILLQSILFIDMSRKFDAIHQHNLNIFWGFELIMIVFKLNLGCKLVWPFDHDN